jgi:hypothetical protein
MNKKSQIDYKIVLAVVCALVIIEVTALCNGINGTVLTLVVGILAAIAGVAIPKEKFIK